MNVEAVTEERSSASRWQRLCYTPLRDLLRGRLSGRLDVERPMASAGLPEPLAELVRRTVRRTRLWRIEKVEVARELTGHFQDGIGAGATADDLVKSFGDPRQAARLIRRAKTRNRPAAWKATRFVMRSLLACFGLLFVVYIGLAIRLYTGSPKLSRNYLAELNAPVLAVPEEDRAWPLYREAFLKTDPVPKHERLNPRDENWPELVAYAERHAEAIQLYHAAARKPHLGRVHGVVNDLDPDKANGGEAAGAETAPAAPVDENPMLFNVLLPELSHLRNAAKLLIIDAHRAALDGDAARACEDVETITGIVEHVSEAPFVISDLVAIAILSLNVDSINTILRDRPSLFSDEQLVRLSHRLAGARGGGRLRVRFAAERCFFEDLIQRLYTDDGQGNGHLTAESPEMLASLYGCEDPSFGALIGGSGGSVLGPPLLSALVAGRREMLLKYEELMAQVEAYASLPLWQRAESPADRETDRMYGSQIERLRYLPLALLMPSLSRASTSAELGTQQRDAALVVLACELYRRHNGNWPASLADLSPRYLPTVPADRFDGQPLRYRLVDGQPVIYSIGVDGDDDGGRAPDSESGRRWVRQWQPPSVVETLKAQGSPEVPDGDWVLWPPID